MTSHSIEVPPAILLLAAVLVFTSFMAALRLAERGREGSAERRNGWNFMAAVVAGAGLWSGNALALVAFGEGGRFTVAHTVAALVAAILTSFVMMTLWTGRGGNGSAVMASGVAAAGFKAVSILTALSIAVRPEPAFDLVLLFIGSAAAGMAVFLAAVVHHGRGESTMLSASALLLLAFLASCDLALGGVFLIGATSFAGTDDLLSLDAIVVLIAVVSFLSIASGMATALIDREGQFASQRRLRELADASVEGLVIVDGNRIVDVNESFLRLVDLTAGEVRGMPFLGELLHTEFGGGAPRPKSVGEGQLQASQGRAVPVEIVPRPIEYHGRPHTVFAVRDLSDRRDAELRMRYLAEHDSLTGLPNRAWFTRELEWRAAAAADGRARFALCCIDLDRFKEANEVFGHPAGDAVLIEAASRLKDLIGQVGVVARLGGDEFAVILDDLSSPRVAGDRADEIVERLSTAYEYLGQRICISASAGIAVAPGDGERSELLLARADMALDRAKAEGRGGYRFFEEAMDEETRLRRALAFDLRDAIGRVELQLHYQPLADVGTREIVGFEALARWVHPRHGVISPAVFVALAEESGQIAELGAWMLRTACAEAASWGKPLRIAVNLSPVQLEQHSLPQVLHGILIATGLSPRRLDVEVTETALLRNPQRALDVLRRLKALGVRISMDDFGTGHSSLSMLQAFPFDRLKVDRSIVDRVAISEQAASIARAVLGLSRSLDIKVLAEGVETESQFEFFSGEDCNEVQGGMFGRPQPIEAYAEILGRSTGEEASSITAPVRSTSDFDRVDVPRRARS